MSEDCRCPPCASSASGWSAYGGLTRNPYTYTDRGALLTAEGPGGTAAYAYNADGSMTQRTTTAGTTDYTDPHTGTTATWEYATWTSPVHRLRVPSTEAIASWNARTPSP